MPWCDSCDRLVDDGEVIEGACPSCGISLVRASAGAMPWRFRFMILATVVYLGWRLYQGVTWLMH